MQRITSTGYFLSAFNDMGTVQMALYCSEQVALHALGEPSNFDALFSGGGNAQAFLEQIRAFQQQIKDLQ